MSIYDRLNNTATSLITKYGRPLVFTKVTLGAFDPATGTSPETSTTYTANIVKDQFNTFERSDSSIQVDDLKLIGEVATYAIDDTVSIESQDYRLVRVDPIKPGPTVVAYELQVRK